jgi:cell division protein FtsZ
MDGARGVLLSISGPSDMTLHEVSTAASMISDQSDPDANIIFGAIIDDTLGDEMRVTVIAAGFDRDRRPGNRVGAGAFSSSVTRGDSSMTGDADDVDIPGFVQG